MRYAKFKTLIEKSKDIKYLDIGYPKIYYEIKELKDKTKDIKFNCTFDIDGICQENRWKRYYSAEQKKHSPIDMCCCHLCYRFIGYLNPIFNEKDLRYYAKHFNQLNGYWRKDKGCILDRNMRSVTCLFYSCLNYNSDEYEKLHILKHEVNMLYQQLTN